MSRRVVVLLIVLGIVVPYCALGAALWLSRGGSSVTRGTYAYLAARPAIPARLMRELLAVCAQAEHPCGFMHLERTHHVGPGAWPPIRMPVRNGYRVEDRAQGRWYHSIGGEGIKP